MNVARAGVKSSSAGTASTTPSPSTSGGAGSVARCSVKREAAEDAEAGDRCRGVEVCLCERRRGGAQRLGRGAGGDVDRHAIVARHASAFGADERAAIEASGVRQDADVIEADLEDDFRGARARREMEVGHADRRRSRVAVEQQVRGERRIEQARAVGEMQLFVDVRLHGGAAGKRGAAAPSIFSVATVRPVGRTTGGSSVKARLTSGDAVSGTATPRVRRRSRREAARPGGAPVGIDERVRAGRAIGSDADPAGRDVDDGGEHAPFVARFVVANGGEVLR